ncbi:MAG: DUF5606 domain-containing protein [Cyclobacteriaceae bacterium]|nr:DUF5606 domain-containing protein [Cyclobacteriaceae bacterium]
MTYKDIASVAGKGGLFKILQPTRSGVILESLDSKKNKLVAGMNHRVSVLDEISIYTTTSEEATPLHIVLAKIHGEFDGDLGVDSKSDNDELRAFFSHILPDHDQERVYTSDIKKIVSWYNVLLNEAPDLLKPQKEKKEQG